MRKLKIKDRKRFERASKIIAQTINGLFIAGILFVSLCFVNTVVKANSTSYEDYTVVQGDTLWSIASKNLKSGQDIREYIYELQEINNIENCMIYPGQVIKIIK